MVMMTLYARQQKRHRCINSFLDSEAEGEDGMIWENGIETWSVFIKFQRKAMQKNAQTTAQLP